MAPAVARVAGDCRLDARRSAVLDHVGFDVSDYDHSKAFYVEAVCPRPA
jgi:hypothetical protein